MVVLWVQVTVCYASVSTASIQVAQSLDLSLSSVRMGWYTSAVRGNTRPLCFRDPAGSIHQLCRAVQLHASMGGAYHP